MFGACLVWLAALQVLMVARPGAAAAPSPAVAQNSWVSA